MHVHAYMTVVVSAFSKSSVFDVHSYAFIHLESVFKKFRLSNNNLSLRCFQSRFPCSKTPFHCGRKANQIKKKLRFTQIYLE